jgi:hypothetical protein
MTAKSTNPLDTYWSLFRCKDNSSVCKLIVSYVEEGSNSTIEELKKNLNEKELFFEALKHVVTTQKSLIKALEINVDNCCWYRRELKEENLLVESDEDYHCPYTRHQAKLLTTNKGLFNALSSSASNQLSFL